MQVFRLMAMPDKVIAFDELPERLLKGFELCRADGFPRHWKEWMGKVENKIMIPPEKDPFTGQLRKFDPIIEKDSFFYLVDWNIKPVEEKWYEVCDFVRQHVGKDVRLKERIEDMAIPLAKNKTDGVSIEPEEVPVIPIPFEYQEKNPKVVSPEEVKEIKEETKIILKCEEPDCVATFEGKYAKNGLRLHMRKHKKETVSV